MDSKPGHTTTIVDDPEGEPPTPEQKEAMRRYIEDLRRDCLAYIMQGNHYKLSVTDALRLYDEGAGE